VFSDLPIRNILPEGFLYDFQFNPFIIIPSRSTARATAVGPHDAGCTQVRRYRAPITPSYDGNNLYYQFILICDQFCSLYVFFAQLRQFEAESSAVASQDCGKADRGDSANRDFWIAATRSLCAGKYRSDTVKHPNHVSQIDRAHLVENFVNRQSEQEARSALALTGIQVAGLLTSRGDTRLVRADAPEPAASPIASSTRGAAWPCTR